MEVEPSFDPGPSNAEDLNRGKYFFFFYNFDYASAYCFHRRRGVRI